MALGKGYNTQHELREITDWLHQNYTVSHVIIGKSSLTIIDPALAANEADLIKAVIKNKGDDIVLTPDSFNSMPSYDFQSSSSVYAMVSLSTFSQLRV